MEQTLHEAIEFARAGRSGQALDIFNDLLSDPANKPAVLGHRAWLHFCAGRYDQALRDYRALEPFDKSVSSDIPLIIAECLIELGLSDEAAGILAREINKNVLDPKIIFLLLKIQNASIDRTHFIKNFEAFSPNVMSNVLASSVAYLPAPINCNLGLLLYSLTRNLAPEYAVEIGSHVGASAIYLAQGLKDNAKGHLYCFDLFDQVLPDFTGRQGNQLDTFGEHMRAAGLSDYVTAIAGDSSINLERLVLPVMPEAPSLIFIDGDHTLKGVIKDFNAVRKWFNPNTLILLHDVNYKHCNWLGPALLAKALYGDRNYNLLTIPTNDQTDLVIIQAKSAQCVKAIIPSFLDVTLHKMYTFGHKIRTWISHV